MRTIAFVLTLSLAALFTACNSQQQSPDQIRRETADATAKIKQDTVAVAQGVKDGVTKPNAVDINSASRADLASTLGVSDAVAGKIVAARPYDNVDQLVTRKVVTEAEFEQIKDKVTVGKK
jgi:DNA uptake protein ComE-like DNA-binding protein